MQVLSHIQQRLDRNELEPKLLELTAMLAVKLEPLIQRSQRIGSSAVASLRARLVAGRVTHGIAQNVVRVEGVVPDVGSQLCEHVCWRRGLAIGA